MWYCKSVFVYSGCSNIAKYEMDFGCLSMCVCSPLCLFFLLLDCVLGSRLAIDDSVVAFFDTNQNFLRKVFFFVMSCEREEVFPFFLCRVFNGMPYNSMEKFVCR